MPQLILIEQYPVVKVGHWKVSMHPETDEDPAYPAIRTGWRYGTTKEGWIYLGGVFRSYQENEEIERGEIQVEIRQGRGDHTYKHLVLYPEREGCEDDSEVYVACFGRFDGHPTFLERRVLPCPARGEHSAYFASLGRPCPDCGEMFDGNGRHPNYGYHQEDWFKLGPKYQKDPLDSSMPDVEVLALGYTNFNRRYWLRMTEGSSLRIPGRPNKDETYAFDYKLSYVGGEVRFELIPDDEDLAAMNVVSD